MWLVLCKKLESNLFYTGLRVLGVLQRGVAETVQFQWGKHQTRKGHIYHPSSLASAGYRALGERHRSGPPTVTDPFTPSTKKSYFKLWSEVSKHNAVPPVVFSREWQTCRSWCLLCKPGDSSAARLWCAKRELLLIQPRDLFWESSCGFCFITDTQKNVFQSCALKWVLSNTVLFRVCFSFHWVGSRVDVGSRKVNILVFGLLWSFKATWV